MGPGSVLPTPESNEEPPPRKEEYPSILVDGIQHRDRSSLPVDRVDDWCSPENRRREHDGSSKFQLHKLVAAASQRIASSHVRDKVVSRATLYSLSKTIPSRHTSTWQACHDQKQPRAHRTTILHGESKTQIEQAKRSGRSHQ